MKILRLAVFIAAPFVLASCSMTSEKGTLAQLRHREMKLEDATIDNGLEKAMDSYRAFLEQTPESEMTPEAIRRIADLSIEKEYGYIGDSHGSPSLEEPEVGAHNSTVNQQPVQLEATRIQAENDLEFENRATQEQMLESHATAGLDTHPGVAGDLKNANARQAIELYRKLLSEYPLYDRNDQVLYQMSRAYEELGEVESAMKVMNQFIATYPQSRYLDEIQFRRAEYYFTHKKYLDAEEAYQTIVAMGPGSRYYELALYKLGWSFYKQQMYEEALAQYFALLDRKVSTGYDFEQAYDQLESKRVEDTFRVISLSFSNLGGPEVVVDFFKEIGERVYENKVYSNLGEFYLDKRRYADAAGSYKAFINGHPFHQISPHFGMRIIDIYKAGRFGQLVIESKKEFSETYALDAEYWQHFDIASRADVVDFLKGNLKDLANHYHAMYQDKRFKKEMPVNYAEALVWYRKYLQSFPAERETPEIHYQMADLMLENKDFAHAARAYEFTSYNYPAHEKSSAAGYSAVYAYREYLNQSGEVEGKGIRQQVISSSLRFAETYPEHEKVTLVLSAAADDLYETGQYSLAVSTARKLLENYADAEPDLRRSAWLVVGHGSYDLTDFVDAEQAYLEVLKLTGAEDKSRPEITDNLAAAIYKQGEQANAAADFQSAADHFLRVGRLAPTSTIRATAEFDAATALIEVQNWSEATDVLLGFRDLFPEHKLQKEITKKIAYVYKSSGQLEKAGAEYERIEVEADDDEIRRGALLLAAELYEQAGVSDKALTVYQRFVKKFPSPVENALEVYSKIAGIYQSVDDRNKYFATLRTVVHLDRTAGRERTDRTRYLAAEASLHLAKPLFDKYAEVEIRRPIKASINKKKKLMKKAVKAYSDLIDYEVADVTSAATYYMAEIYFNFSQSLKNSERPEKLSALELEEYELALEDQIFPFEEKAIAVHRKNVELLYVGVYSEWIEKSIGKLAEVFPALYARDEEHTGFVDTIDSFTYSISQPTREMIDQDKQANAPQAPLSGKSNSDLASKESVFVNL